MNNNATPSKSDSTSSLYSLFKNNRGMKLKLRLVFFLVLLVLMVIAGLISGTIAPWLMTRQAGMNAVSSTVETLAEEQADHLRDKISSFLTPVIFLAINDVKEYLTDGDYQNISAATGATAASAIVLKTLIDDCLKFAPDWSMRYHCLAWPTGDMSCIKFESATHDIWIQQTRVIGGQWKQIQWLCDHTTHWNASWPTSNYDDLGPYDAASWVLPYASVTEPFWTGSYVEITNAQEIELINSFGTPLHDTNGNYLGITSIGMLERVFGDFLESYVDTSSRAVILDDTDYVMGSSVTGMSITGLDNTGYPTVLPFKNVSDPLLKQIAAQYSTGTEVSDVTVKNADGSQEKMKVFSRAITENYFAAHIVTAIPESKFNEPLVREAQSAMTVGIVIIVIWPIVFSAVALCLSILIIVSTSKLKELAVESDELSTGMDFAISTLQSLQKANARNKSTVAALESVLSVLCSGNANKLFKPDIEVAAKAGKLQEDQLVYLRGELAMTKGDGNSKEIAMNKIDLVEVVDDNNQPDCQLPSATPQEEVIPEIPNLSCWTFSVLTLVSEHPLVDVAMQCMNDQGLFQQFRLNKTNWKGFFTAVEATYHPQNPYHNATHAADMVQAIHSMIFGQIEAGVNFNMTIRLSPLERLTMLIAGAVHDAGHTGQNNNFHVATESSFALAFNDQSVMENHHLVTGWKLLREFGVLKQFDSETIKEVRRLLINLVLATDMSQHFQILSEFKAAIQSGAGFEKGTEFDGRGELKPETKLLVMKMIFKMADTSNATRPMDSMKEWAKRVFDEFLLQGDLEKKLGIPVTPHMDRNTSRLPRLQNNFLQFVAIPMWKAFNEFTPIPQIIKTLDVNHNYWLEEDTKLSKSASTMTTDDIRNINTRGTSRGAVTSRGTLPSAH